jgi:hypothetical protein
MHTSETLPSVYVRVCCFVSQGRTSSGALVVYVLSRMQAGPRHYTALFTPHTHEGALAHLSTVCLASDQTGPGSCIAQTYRSSTQSRPILC